MKDLVSCPLKPKVAKWLQRSWRSINHVTLAYMKRYEAVLQGHPLHI